MMNKKGILCLAVFVLFFSSIAFTQTITVTSPNGGETLVSGETHTITWTSSGITSGTFTVLLFEGTTSIGTIERGIACGDGSHSITWTVGNYSGGTAPSGSNYKIKVRQASESPKDFSNAAFTISGPADPDPDPGTSSITVTSPNGGEIRFFGSTGDITWTSFGITSGLYKITLWDGETNVGIIASDIPFGDVSYTWETGHLSDGRVVPPGGNYRIKIRVIGETSLDFSDSNFAIHVGPEEYISIIKPAAGEVWLKNQSNTIEWDFPWSSYYKARVSLINAGGGLVTVISNDQTCDYRDRNKPPRKIWMVPDTLSPGSYKVRVEITGEFFESRNVHADSPMIEIRNLPTEGLIRFSKPILNQHVEKGSTLRLEWDPGFCPRCSIRLLVFFAKVHCTDDLSPLLPRPVWQEWGWTSNVGYLPFTVQDDLENGCYQIKFRMEDSSVIGYTRKFIVGDPMRFSMDALSRLRELFFQKSKSKKSRGAYLIDIGQLKGLMYKLNKSIDVNLVKNGIVIKHLGRFNGKNPPNWKIKAKGNSLRGSSSLHVQLPLNKISLFGKGGSGFTLKFTDSKSGKMLKEIPVSIKFK